MYDTWELGVIWEGWWPSVKPKKSVIHKSFDTYVTGPILHKPLNCTHLEYSSLIWGPNGLTCSGIDTMDGFKAHHRNMSPSATICTYFTFVKGEITWSKYARSWLNSSEMPPSIPRSHSYMVFKPHNRSTTNVNIGFKRH